MSLDKAESVKSRSPYFSMLLENNVSRAGSARNTHDCRIPEGVTIDMVCTSSYWKQAAYKLRPMDLLYILPVDQSYYAELLVLQAQTGVGASVEVLIFKDLLAERKERVPSLSDEYTIAWRGGAKWCVIRNKDNVKVAQGLDSEIDAQRELSSHLASRLS